MVHETDSTNTRINNEIDESTDSTEDEFHSMDSESDSDSDSDQDDSADTPEARQVERGARAKERQRVLEAAGLVIKHSDTPPPIRKRSIRKRRPPPPAPIRLNHEPTSSDLIARTEAPVVTSPPVERELPPIPEPSPPTTPTDLKPVTPDALPRSPLQIDDAFERYESFKAQSQRENRMSTISILTSSTATADTISLSPPSPGSIQHNSPRNTFSRLHELLTGARGKTPGQEERPSRISTANISGPLLSNTTTTPVSRENSPAFGSVSSTNHICFADKRV
jgi:actin cytoskeleton-regulatory complex protein PAN1